MKRGYRFVACALILALMLPQAAFAQGAEGFGQNVRIKLSIGDRTSFKFTPVGEFTLLEDSGVKVGTEELTVKAAGGRVSIEFANKTVTAPSLTLKSAHYGERTDYIRLRNSEHGTCTYLGDITFDVVEGSLRAINTLPMEQYLYGVVPNEMSNSFPIDALKAQAVCARSFALSRCYRYQSRSYDLVDTSKDQTYHGYASKNRRAIAAVDATAGELLTYENKIVEAYYSSSNGGQTDTPKNVWDSDEPFYAIVDDPYDLMNASSIEELSFIPDEFTDETRAMMDAEVLSAIQRAANEAAGESVTLLSTIAVTPAEPEHEGGSRCYTRIDIALAVSNGQEEGQLTVSLAIGDLSFGSFNNTLGKIGARKTRLRMSGAERTEGGWNITMRRWGHGVGMSQRSAQVRARLGQSYDEILAFYYIDTKLGTFTDYASAPKIESDKYAVSAAAITGVAPGTSAEDMLKNLTCAGGTLSIMSAKGAETAGTIGTGCFVRISYEDGAKYCDIPIVIFGDTDGSGKIDTDDIVAIQKHMLHVKLLGGAYLAAADADHNGKIELGDIITLLRHINGDGRLKQEG